MKVAQAYADASIHDDQLVESFYEDVEAALNKVKAQYTVLVGDFEAVVAQRLAGDQAVGEFDIAFRNSKGELVVEST